MEWLVHGEREVYRSDWVTLSLVDVEVPGGNRYEHHAVVAPDAAGALVTDAEDRVLVLWRHRFLTGEWGWEIPAGLVDRGEEPMAAARRECVEESGWDPGTLRPTYRFSPIAGLSRQTFWVFRGEGATQVGEPDPAEATRIDWLDRAALRRALEANEVFDAMSVIALMGHLALG
jgi:8-oxo-dGTP pyrophosphatase MutT (NUDIX family)